MSSKPSHRRIDAIYATLPAIECQGKCQKSCGPIMMSKAEWDRIRARLGTTPEGDSSLTCPMLNQETGKCKVYSIRPTICRLWGLVRKMACPWGCVPERWLSDDEARRIILDVKKAGGGS